MLTCLGTENLLNVFSHNDLLLDKHLGKLHDSAPIVCQNLLRPSGGFIGKSLGFGIYQLCSLLAIRLAEFVAPTVGIIVGQIAHLIAHSVIADHRIGHLGHPFEIVQRSGAGDSASDNLLGDSSGDKHTHLVLHSVTGHHHLLVRQTPGKSKGLSTRDNGNLQHGIATLEQPTYYGVTGLVISGKPLLLGRHQGLFPFYTGHYPIDGIAEVAVVNA